MHTQTYRTSRLFSFFRLYCTRRFGVVEGRKKKEKKIFSAIDFLVSVFFLLTLLYHFIYSFRKKSTRREDELSEMIGARKEIFLIQQMLVVYNTHRSGMVKNIRKKIFFNIKLYSFTSVDNSCFFISFSLSLIFFSPQLFSSSYSSVPFNRMRLLH